MITNPKEVRDLFQIEIDSTDNILHDLIMAAQASAEKYCDTIFESTSITEYHDGDGSQVILTKKCPIISVDSIHDDVDRVFGSDALMDAADYVVSDDGTGKIELLTDVTTPGIKNIKVVYAAGFALVPNDIKIAAANYAMASYIEGNGGVNAIQGQDFTYKPEKLRKAAEAVLDRYKKFR